MKTLLPGWNAIHANQKPSTVNFCMTVPMASEPLPWTSQQLAALTASVESIPPGFEPAAGGADANPCNPCGSSNPCGAQNPCGGR